MNRSYNSLSIATNAHQGETGQLDAALILYVVAYMLTNDKNVEDSCKGFPEDATKYRSTIDLA